MKNYSTFQLLSLLFIFLCSSLIVDAQVIPLKVRVNTPDGVDFKIDAIQANFGPMLDFQELTGDVAWVTDGVTEPTDGDTWSAVGAYGCDSLINGADLNGKIALIGRGACEFGVKVLNAEVQGAVAAIVANRAPIGLTIGTHTDGLIWMGAGAVGDSTTIPSLFISYEDRAVIEKIMADNPGTPVNLTIEHYWMYEAAAAYAYSTPATQVRALDDISLIVANRDTFELYDFSFTATITDPDGNVTELTTVQDTIPRMPTDGFSPETQISFDSYTPSVPGVYTVVYTATTPAGDHPLDSESYETTFEVGDNATYSVGIGTSSFGQSIHPQAYVDIAALAFNVGSFYRTGEMGEMAVSATFGLTNPADLTPGLEFVINIYDVSPDGDFDLDNNMDGTVDDLDLLETVVGTGTYALTGDEAPNVPILVELDAPAALEANKIYLIMVESDGLLGDNFAPPSYLASGEYITADYGSVFQMGRPGEENHQIEIDGFEFWNDDTPGFPHGGRHPIVRMHMDGFVGSNDLPLLDGHKVSLAPNPATDILNLNFQLDETADEIQLAILDITGRVIQASELNNVQNGSYEIKVNLLPAGTHFLSIITPEGFRTEKFVVVK